MQNGVKTMKNRIYRSSQNILFLGEEDCSVTNVTSEFIFHLKGCIKENSIYDISLNFVHDLKEPVFSFQPYNSSKEITFLIRYQEKDFYSAEIENNEASFFLPLLKKIKPEVLLIFMVVPTTGYNGLLDRLAWYFRECQKINMVPIFYLKNLENIQSDLIKEWLKKRKYTFTDFLFLFLFKRNSLPDLIVKSVNEQTKIVCNQIRDFNSMYNLKLKRQSRFYKMFQCWSSGGNLSRQLMHTIITAILSKDKFFKYYLENEKILFEYGQ